MEHSTTRGNRQFILKGDSLNLLILSVSPSGTNDWSALGFALHRDAMLSYLIRRLPGSTKANFKFKCRIFYRHVPSICAASLSNLEILSIITNLLNYSTFLPPAHFHRVRSNYCERGTNIRDLRDFPRGVFASCRVSFPIYHPINHHRSRVFLLRRPILIPIQNQMLPKS